MLSWEFKSDRDTRKYYKATRGIQQKAIARIIETQA